MQVGEQGSVGGTAPGWYPDPSGRYVSRWYDGRQWTPQALDVRQRPVFDPLPGQTGAVPGFPSVPATGPAPGGAPGSGSGAVPAGAASAPVAPVPVGALVFRCLVLGVAAVLFLFGFVVLPYAGVDTPPRDFSYAPTRYLELGPWLRAYDTGMSGWGRLYSGGLAPLLAAAIWVVVVVSVLLVALVPAYRARPPWWPVLVFVAVMLGALAVMIGSPVNGTVMLQTESGYLVVLIGHLLLAVACPLTGRKQRRSRTSTAVPGPC
ncbi:DUF2510 domain-containing protein [Micromonospora sp. HM5-17]|uniref:DUF2510 domain-containing protein n=1 Tax=Micromonospora sp. HM5-17 TaxID=2487710 RepID=UPI0013159038|nr:DUF2510 domain-containing protein [Micromonospora sp. HM5-17]